MTDKKFNPKMMQEIMRAIREEFDGKLRVTLDLSAVSRIVEIFSKKEEEFKEKEKINLHEDSLLGRGLTKKSDEEIGWFPGDCCD